MPEEGLQFESDDKIMTFEEIASVVRVLATLGVSKLRLTGGEPMVRKDLPKLIKMLSAIDGIEDIALTTNGIFLASQAIQLKEAGLTRVNISLDSLRADRFTQITRGGDVQKVLNSIDACLKANIGPIKLNVVLMNGINDDEVGDFLRLSVEKNVHVRFIEYMPIGHHDAQWKQGYRPLKYVLDVANELGLTYKKDEGVRGNGPSENYRIIGGSGGFGLIHPVSDHFCETCNRLRLTADGNIKPCLFWSDEFNIRPFIGDDEAVKHLFFRALDIKPENHEMAKQLIDQATAHQPTARRMSQIGG
jgi:cyclic pyranopterin phosphate synthase